MDIKPDDPTPEEIRRLCWAIQETWSEGERLKRSAWSAGCEVVEAPTMKVAEFVADRA